MPFPAARPDGLQPWTIRLPTGDPHGRGRSSDSTTRPLRAAATRRREIRKTWEGSCPVGDSASCKLLEIGWVRRESTGPGAFAPPFPAQTNVTCSVRVWTSGGASSPASNVRISVYRTSTGCASCARRGKTRPWRFFSAVPRAPIEESRSETFEVSRSLRLIPNRVGGFGVSRRTGRAGIAEAIAGRSASAEAGGR